MDCNFKQIKWEKLEGKKGIDYANALGDMMMENHVNVKRRLKNNIKETQKQIDFYENAGIGWKVRQFKIENKTFTKVLSWMK